MQVENTLTDVIDNAPVDCEGVDYHEIEELGTTIAGHVQELVMNVDISTAQYNTEQLFEEAHKLGMSFGDLREYGYDPRNSSCAPSADGSKDFLQDLDCKMSGQKGIRDALLRKGEDMYR